MLSQMGKKVTAAGAGRAESGKNLFRVLLSMGVPLFGEMIGSSQSFNMKTSLYILENN